MASNWVSCELGDILELKRGYDLPKTKRVKGNVPVVSSSGTSGEHNEIKVKSPGVVTGRYGTIGQVFYIEEDFWPLNTTLYVKDFKGNDPLYVYYFLKTIRYSDYTDKGAVPGINRNHIHKAKVTVPVCPKHQRNLALSLFDIDNKIELNQQTNQTLEQMAQTLFKSWFVDFDPVFDNALAKADFNLDNLPSVWPAALVQRATSRLQVLQLNPTLKTKLTQHNQVVTENNTAQAQAEQSENTHQHFPSEFECTDELSIGIKGWIPKGWEDSNVGKEFDVIMGQSPPGSTYNEINEGIPFFQGKTDYGFRFPSNRIYCTAPKRLAQKNDTLVSVRAPVGTINLAAEQCAIGRGLAAVRHKSGSISFTYYAMNNMAKYFEVFEGEGTVFGSINQRDFNALPQLSAPSKLVSLFNQFCTIWDEKIELTSSQIDKLTKLRDTLLPKLISGELQISDSLDVMGNDD